jgi:hypothetical protein
LFYAGGKIKKTFLASVGMAAAASVCYPREAVEIGGAGWQTVTDFVKTAYRDNFPGEYFVFSANVILM